MVLKIKVMSKKTEKSAKKTQKTNVVTMPMAYRYAAGIDISDKEHGVAAGENICVGGCKKIRSYHMRLTISGSMALKGTRLKRLLWKAPVFTGNLTIVLWPNSLF